MRQLERNVLLNVLDRKWREHLYEMDYLKEGIGLRAMAQRDPLVEYQREGYDMFTGMLDALRRSRSGSCSTSGRGRAADPDGRRSADAGRAAGQGIRRRGFQAAHLCRPSEDGDAEINGMTAR